MKRIKYIFLSSEVNYGTEELPNIKKEFIHKDFLYSDETLEAAKHEAYNGEYEIYEDGLEEPVPVETTETTDDVLNALLGVM